MKREKKLHGLSEKQQLSLFEISQNPQLRNFSHINALHDATVLAMQSAGGKKDSARNWSRYFLNAKTYDVLVDSGAISADKLAAFRSLQNRLRDNCHPEEQISLETDLQAIRASLARLVELAEQNHSPVFPFFSAAKSGLVTPDRAGLTGLVGSPRQAPLSASAGN